MQKTLIILRHAKAETGTAKQEDHTRSLAAKGIVAAGLVGAYLAGRAHPPQLTWCSSALRTRQTLEKIQESFRPPLKVEYRDKLYNASAAEIMSMLAAASPEVESIMVIGHNPGLHQLAYALSKTGDAKMLDTLAVKFPTATLAVIGIDTPWRNIAQARGELQEFVTPKMLGGEEE